MSGRLKRGTKLQTGYRISPDIEQKMNRLIEDGEFVNRADIITTALRFWLEWRQFDVALALREYLQSEDGQKLIRDIVKKR